MNLGKQLRCCLNLLYVLLFFVSSSIHVFLFFLTPAHIKQKQHGDGQKDPDIHNFHVN